MDVLPKFLGGKYDNTYNLKQGNWAKCNPGPWNDS